MTRFILVVAALFSVACAASLDWRIVGGSKADDGQFPYQVSLRDDGSHFCGGSILNEEWILTAAHCVELRSTSPITVVAGTNKLDAGGDSYDVARVVVHKGWDSQTVKNDIALLKIYGKIAFNAKVQSIPLGKDFVGDGEDMLVSGWGLTSYPGERANDLQFLRLKAISSEECHERHASSGLTVDDTQVCTLAPRGEGVCSTDSGGPLVHKGRVAGVVSWGRLCALGYPDVFARVTSYVGWIHENMK